MTQPPIDFAEGAAWLVIVAIVALAAGFVIGITSDARHGRATPLTAALEGKP